MGDLSNIFFYKNLSKFILLPPLSDADAFHNFMAIQTFYDVIGQNACFSELRLYGS